MANTKTGRVVSNASDRTITVLVIAYKNHPIYKKRYIYSKKYLVHDPQNEAKAEDMVIIKQSRPISRHKRWILEKVVSRKSGAVDIEMEIERVDKKVSEVKSIKKPTLKPTPKKPTPKKPTPKKPLKKASSKAVPKQTVAKKKETEK